MTFAALGWIIAGIGIPLLSWGGLYFMRKATLLRAENESLKKTSAVKSGQLDISARPADSPDVLLDRMYNDG